VFILPVVDLQMRDLLPMLKGICTNMSKYSTIKTIVHDVDLKMPDHDHLWGCNMLSQMYLLIGIVFVQINVVFFVCYDHWILWLSSQVKSLCFSKMIFLASVNLGPSSSSIMLFHLNSVLIWNMGSKDETLMNTN
jgi:hypothetical protein